MKPSSNGASKQAPGSGKIDPLMTLFNTVSLMSANPDADQSVYEDRGMMIFLNFWIASANK